MYSKQKFFLILLVVLRYPIDKDSQEFSKLESYILKDYQWCPKCFEKQSEFCKGIRNNYEFDEDLTNNLNILFGVRHIRILREINNTNHRIFAKYLARDFDFSFINQGQNEKEAVVSLSKRFFNESLLDGMQFCPQNNAKRFVDFFAKNHSQQNIWMYMNVNIQPILLPYLHSMGFPVPKTYASCGFTTFQSDEGVPLANLYSSDFKVKLKIAIQLIEGALKFSQGFEGFRIYITDLNMDNVVYNLSEDKLSFVDLDTVFIVDGKKYPGSIHKHEYLECDDCFAFSPTDICAHGLSDINLFAVCQLLRENLRKDVTMGFLYPVPERYLELKEILNECVDCRGEICKNRFPVAVRLVEVLKGIIKNSL